MSIGKSYRRVDGIAKVTGQAQYSDDFFMRDMAYAKVFRSTIANGFVKSINVHKARAIEGVLAVFTYEDVPDLPFSTAGHPYTKDIHHKDIADRLLLNRRVRLIGDEIAVVVAENPLIAEKACAAITVEYEEYPALVTPKAALVADATEIHSGTNNILGQGSYCDGDVDAIFATADHVFEQDYYLPTVQHVAMENHTAYAYIDENQKITVVTATQIPHICRWVVAEALGISWGKVRVIKPFVGGGFGSKQDVVQEPLVAFLTWKLHGRPVRLQYSREETFLVSRVRHAMDIKIKTAVSKDGKILAGSMEAISDNGAYASHGQSVVNKTGSIYRFLYDYQAVRFDSKSVYTNKPSAGAMRGYGAPQATFAMESHYEDIARALNIDAVEFRLKNIRPHGYYLDKNDIYAYTDGLRECVERGKKLIDWDRKKAAYAKQEGSLRRGLGMAIFSYNTGVHPFAIEFAGARIVMNEDASIQLQVGATEIGQGSDTVFLQMAAETIGIPFEKCSIVSAQDTDISPYDTGAYASRQTYVTGMAVRKAAEEIKAKVIEYASGMLDKPEFVMDIKDGWLVYKEGGAKIAKVSDITYDAYCDLKFGRPITADVGHNARVNALAFGCTFVDLEIDIPLAQVTIKEIYNVHDSGRIINPQLAEGQVHGGMSMALGYAMYEIMQFDEKTGKPLNPNLLDYKLMTTLDTPELGVEFVETNIEPNAPYGNRALGEPPTCSPAPAIRNAILAATGVAFYELPINPHKLMAKFQQHGLL